jgi:DNA-binding FrmR family transcriptional regulator
VLKTRPPTGPEDTLETTTRADALKRLNYIEGHLDGIRKMVEEDRYCVDILRQTYAVRRAVQKLETSLVGAHLKSCVAPGVRDGREEQVLKELVELYEIADR